MATPERLEDRTLLSASVANPNANVGSTGTGSTGTGSTGTGSTGTGGTGTGTGGTGTGTGGTGTGTGTGGTTTPTLVLNAGLNAATTIDNTASLTGTMTYSDPSAPQPLATTWSVVSGPGTVNFSATNSLTTSALFSATGTYVLQLSGTDGSLSASSQVTILVTPPLPDEPPTVSAGANQATTVGATLNLAGTVSDNSPQAQLSIQWSQISGPGIAQVTFGTPTSANTTAVFSQAGTYVLNLSATDGTLAASSQVVVTVNPSTVNPAPVVSAGPNQTVLQNATVTLNGSASTSTGTLSTVWQVANAPGGTFFTNPNSPQTTAVFSTPGIYQIRLVASNGTYTTTSYSTITVNPTTQTTSSFQLGVNGYTGSSDAYISSSLLNANFGTAATLLVKNSGPTEDALIQWNVSSLATSASVSGATITLDVTTAAAGITYNLYAVNHAWNASQVTFTSSSTGVKWGSLGAGGAGDSGSTIIGSFTASAPGLVNVTLNSAGLALVQSWVNSPATNFGVIIRAASGTTQLTLASNENATPANRPQLSITTLAQSGTYTPPPITNVTTTANTAFYGFDNQRDGYMAPVGLTLDNLYFQYQQWQQNGSQGTFTTANPLIHLNGNSVLVEATATANVSSLVTSLKALGMQVTGVAGPDVSGWLPINQLANLAMTSGLNFAETASYFVSNPADSTQGAKAIGATQAQTQFGVTGTGITVGILSDSFNATGGYSTDVANGQLPGNVINLADAGGTDEGRAMTQIVYAEAPGAQLAFATANGGSPAFAQNIMALQSQANANVEVDDVGYFDQPFFQEGIVAQAADAVAANGVAYFSAAGNDGSQAWQGGFNNSGLVGLFPGSTLNNFGGSAFQQITIPVGSGAIFDFQWNQPFASVGGKGSASQMDIFLLSAPSLNPANIVGLGINNTIGGDALQFFSFGNDGSFGTSTFYIAIEHDSGPVPTVMKWIGASDGAPFIINTFATNSGTTFGQPVALGAAGVGAAAYTNTPAFGVTPPILESFSSTGAGTEFLFDTSGNPLPAPLPRNQPLFTGVDGANLDVAGTNGFFSPFFGTSAAAPSVAGVAALMLQESGGAGTLSPNQIYQIMENTATPMSSTPGYNSNSGFGLVNGVAAVQAAQNAPKTNVPTVTLSVTTNPLIEVGGTTQVIATLSKVSSSPVTVVFQFSGTAALGTQYTASATKIVIPAGQTFGSITLTGVNDGLVTGPLTIIVTLFSATNARPAGGSQSVTIIRTDSNTPQIGLTISGGAGPDGKTLLETGGTLTVTATLTQALPDPVQVNLGFSGTAIFGTNYTASAKFITIAAGSLSGSITLTGISNPIPNVPTASLFVTIESVVDTTKNTTINVPAVPGAGTAMGQVVDNFILGNPFGQIPVVSLPTTQGIAISDMGGKTTITISQSTVSQVDDPIQLLFSGTGVNGTNYTITDASGQPLGDPNPARNKGVVVIPRGQLSTTITITGLDDGFVGPDHTLIISLGNIGQGQPSPTNNSVTVTILQLDSKPAVGLTLSQPVFTQGGQITVTATLMQTTNVDVFVNLSFTGTATPNIEYSVTDGSVHTNQIRITAGMPSGSVTLTGLPTAINRQETTVTVGIASVIGAVVQQSFQPITANYVNARVPVTFSVQGAVTMQGGVAAVQVVLSRPEPFPVSVDYQINDGTALANQQYLLPNGSRRGTLTFAAGITQQTIYISTIPSVPTTPAALNFTVTLDTPSLDVSNIAAPPPAGAAIGNDSATVSIIETSTVAQSSVATTLQSGGTSPPDIAAAVGTATPPVPPSTPGIPPRIVVMTNNQYTVFDYNSGFIITQTTLDQFWVNAGLTGLAGDAVNPRIEFNPILQRFFAVAINPVGGTNNNVLFAVSKTQDPLGGWSAFTLPVDPTAKVFSATGVALGMDSNAIYITADLVNPVFGNTSETGFSIPISNFNNGAAATTNFTQYFNIPSGFELQPEFNPTINPGQPETLLSGNSTSPNALLSFIIAGANNPNAAISPPTPLTIPGGGTITDPPPATQPGGPSISDGPAGFSGTVYQSVNDIWAVETVADATSGHSDIRWYELSATTGAIQQTGLIKDPNLSFYNASVAAVTDPGVGDQVVISFTGSGANQFASAYAVIGQTTGPLNNQLTTFTTPVLLTPGAGSYNVPVNGVNAWGNYSSTVADPNFGAQRFGVSGGQAVFWTFQEFASAPNVWSVEMVEIVVAVPPATPLPQVALSVAPGETVEEDGGVATVSAVMTAASTDNVEVSLIFTGSAILNHQYVPSATTIFIPAGQTSGSITLTGLPVDLFGTFTVTIGIAQSTLYNATPGSPTTASLPVNDTDPVAAGDISGKVYNDLNFDGVFDNNEPSIPNVILYIDKNGNNTFDVGSDPYIFSTADAGPTNYTFFGIAAGSYAVDQIVPPQFGQTQPAGGVGYPVVVPPASGINFGDAAVTNPPTTLSVNIPQITDDHSSGTFTITLGQRTQAAVSLTILVGGMADFSDYTLTGPGGVIPLTSAAPTFVAVIPAGQTSVSYTITATGDMTGTNETITFRALSITNATIAGSSQVETSIVSTTGTPQIVIGSPTQVSSTGLNPGFSFGAANSTFTTANQPDFITTADLNGNGIPDLIVANSQASSITVILDPTSANPVTKNYPVGTNPTGIVAADFNGDGALDLAISTANGVTILQNNGFGGFTLIGGYATGSAPSALTAGDFNGDGKVDIAVANMNSNNVSILYGNGNMTFKAAVNIAVGQAPTDIKAVDLNNNGTLDLVVANNGSSSNSVTVLMNNGTGTFTSASYLAGVQPRSLAIADFNDDGNLDIAVANVGNAPNQSGSINTVTVLFGNGTGKFTPVPLPLAGQPLPTGTYAAGPSVFSIAAGDVSGDGVPDLVVANHGVGDNSISVLTNNGNGTFSAPTFVPVGTGNLVQSVVTGDFYGNGAIDIASANSFGTAGVNGATIFKNANIPASLLFHVYLSRPATSTVTVKFATQNGTGQAFVDYTPTSGTLCFAPGTTVETVAVPILANAGSNKTVILQLATATNAPIQIGTGVGTINPLPFVASTASATPSGANLVVNDSTQNDSLQVLQLSANTVEVLVNGQKLGIYGGITGQLQVNTPNGLDNIYVDEEVTEAGTVTNAGVLMNPNFGDFVFAELLSGKSWLLQA